MTIRAFINVFDNLESSELEDEVQPKNQTRQTITKDLKVSSFPPRSKKVLSPSGLWSAAIKHIVIRKAEWFRESGI